MTPGIFYNYESLLSEVLNFGKEETNQRTERQVKTLLGETLVIDLSEGFLPVPKTRKVFPRTAAVELAWSLLGKWDIEWLNDRQVHIWDKFAVDGTVENAYGYRWREYFIRDQIADALRTLKANPSDRQIVISAWDPEFDGLGRDSLNVPCPAMFTLNVLQGKLYSTMLMRSSDVFVGLPYDLMNHAFLLDAISVSLGITLGSMTFSLANVHLYDSHWIMARDALSQKPVASMMRLPRIPVEDICEYPDKYLSIVKLEAARRDWPTYSPKPEVVQ